MPVKDCSADGEPGVKWGDEGTCYTYDPDSDTSQAEAVKKALAQGIAMGDIDVERDAARTDVEYRAPGDVDLTVTAEIADNAQRGLRLYEDGKGGDGLVRQTIIDARKMANREALSEQKVRRMPGWFARHETDKVPGWDEPGEETPGFVAWLLWGGDEARDWAERKVEQLDKAKADRGLPDSEQRTVEICLEDVPADLVPDLMRILEAMLMTDAAEEEDEAEDAEPDVPPVVQDDGEQASARERSVSPVLVQYRESGAGANYRTITGYASVFNRMSEDLGGFREMIAPGAFRDVIARGANVKLLYDHDSASVLASTGNGSLELREDDTGLHVWARVDMTDPDVQRVAAKLRSGIVDQMSFAFTVKDDEWDYTGGMPVRTVRAIDDLFEVSVVAFPAYNDTKVMMLERALTAGRLPTGGATDTAPETAGGESHDIDVVDPVQQRAAYWRARFHLQKQKAG